MKLLLDTHVFLWYITDDAQLPIFFRDAIRNPQNQVYFFKANCNLWATAQRRMKIAKG